MDKITLLLVFVVPDVCYAGRGGYSLGESPFGDFFAKILYLIWIVYLYYGFFSHFNELKRQSLRDNLVIVAVLMFWSVPLFIPFLTSDKKPSSSTISNTYVREEYSRPTREYSAPKSDYRPIELPKTYTPTIAPNLERVSSPLTTEPIHYEPPTVDRITAPIPDKKSAQVPEPIAILEDEAARKEFEAKVEIARQQWDAYYEANHEKWEAELEAARKNLEANLETARGNRIIEPEPYLHEPEPYYYPEPEPVISEPQPYEVAEKSPDEVLKDLERELRRINSR